MAAAHSALSEMFEKPASARAPALFREILESFARHVDRQDTVEGVAQWWLLENRIEWTVAAVKAALSELVSQRLVLEKLGADGRAYYRINRRRLKVVRALLESTKAPEPPTELR